MDNLDKWQLTKQEPFIVTTIHNKAQAEEPVSSQPH